MGRVAENIISLCSGIAIGVSVGILYAPDKGTNTRHRLTYRLDKYRGKLREIIAQLSSEQDLHVNSARTEGQKVVSDAKEKAERLLTDVEELMSQIKGKN
jgi:gas vesicle protein